MTLNSFLIVHVHHPCQIFFSIRRKEEEEEKVETEHFLFFLLENWKVETEHIENTK